MREFTATLDLRPFGTGQRQAFDRALHRATNNLLTVLPRSARRWGLARKGLNIFLRGCLYNKYLADAFTLDRAERLFEVPLDSITATSIRRESPDQVPVWRSVKGLTEEESGHYQAAAAHIAKQQGIARVHLDAVWWGQR